MKWYVVIFTTFLCLREFVWMKRAFEKGSVWSALYHCACVIGIVVLEKFLGNLLTSGF